jgi:hypothetical protein
MSATGVEMRFGEPVSPEAVRVEIFKVEGELVEEARVPTTSCRHLQCGTRHRPAPAAHARPGGRVCIARAVGQCSNSTKQNWDSFANGSPRGPCLHPAEPDV